MYNLFLFTYTTKQEQKDKQAVYLYFSDDRSWNVHYRKTTKPSVITKSEARAKTKPPVLSSFIKQWKQTYCPEEVKDRRNQESLSLFLSKLWSWHNHYLLNQLYWAELFTEHTSWAHTFWISICLDGSWFRVLCAHNFWIRTALYWVVILGNSIKQSPKNSGE